MRENLGLSKYTPSTLMYPSYPPCLRQRLDGYWLVCKLISPLWCVVFLVAVINERSSPAVSASMTSESNLRAGRYNPGNSRDSAHELQSRYL